MPHGPTALHGRTAQSTVLREIIAGAAAARGGAIVVRGEPGTGKTALLTDAADHATGVLVLRTQGIESESPLAFAALQRLLWPVLDHLDRIPAAQAQALRVALGESAEPALPRPDDRFVVFVATLSLLAEVAEEQPVLCVVDDAHWLDAASAEALLFVARRLGSDRVAIAFGAREGDVRRFDGPGLPELVLTGLDPAAAAALLAEHIGTPVPPGVRDELLARTGGNPLALVELPDVLTEGQLSGRSRLPAQLPLTEGVERAFVDRCRRLPEPAQTLLLVIAADDSGRVSTVVEAGVLLGVRDTALDDVERSGLAHVRDGRISVRHPLVRSGVYAAASSGERRAVHRALASALSSTGDLDRRTWHLSLAATAADDDLAAALDAVADRATRRGGHEAASAAYERAAELTAGADARASRLFAAAMSAWQAGEGARSRLLADEGRAHALEPRLQADLDRLRGRLEWNVGSPQAGFRIVMDAARQVVAVDPVRALEMAMLGTTLATFGAASDAVGDPSASSYLLPLEAAAAPRLQCLAALLVGHEHLLRGDDLGAATSLRRAFAIAQDLPPDIDVLANVGIGAFHLGDDEVTTRSFQRLLTLGREQGSVSTAVTALTRLPCGQLPAAQWQAATASADEALVLARGIGQPALAALPLTWLAVLAAYRGEPAITGLLAEIEQLRAAHPLGIVTVAVDDATRWAKGIQAANDHDAGGATHHLAQIGNRTIGRLAALDRIEAAVRSVRLDLARTWVEEMAAFGTATGARWAAAIAEHGWALLADGEVARDHFDRALDLHAGAGRPLDHARTQLAYGEFLRRSGRRVEARGHLAAALETFADVGAAPWAARATQELRASGESARKRDVTTTADLTPQERQTALLVGQGLSNREIAARLFLSPRTVEYHLSNTYQKLGVRSRVELAQLGLGGPMPAG